MLITLIRTFASTPQLCFVVIMSYLIAIMSAIILHEFAHGMVAYWNGDMTAKYEKRLTLNPIKHFDIIGFLMMIIVGFGWAKPVPIDPRNFRDYKKGMITVSLAGVITNFILAIVGAIILGVFILLTKDVVFVTYNFAFYSYAFFRYLLLYSVIFNLTLMAFNILPLFPLDGFRVVETLAKPNNRYVDFMYKYGNFVLLGLLLVSTFLGQFAPYLDIFGMYINSIVKLVSIIFSAMGIPIM
ncbi:MAG: site-2 protease family protein [Clostridia bacterium]